MTSTSSGTDDVHETSGEPTGGLAEALVEALALDAETEEFVQRARDQLEGDQVMRDNHAADRTEVTANEVEHVKIVNEYRRMMGKRPVRINYKLTQAARRHASYLKESGQFAHNVPGHPDGASPGDRAVTQGYAAGVGENIAMNSGGHTPLM